MDKKKILITLIVLGLLLSSFTLIAGAHYVGSKSSDVYHYPSCHYVDRIRPENLIDFDTPEDAIAAGYRPCKVCKPPTKSSPTLTPTPTPSPTLTLILSPSPSPINWIERADTPTAGGYGEAVVSTGSYIYIARCSNAFSSPEFWSYNLNNDIWISLNISGLPIGAFRNGAAFTWDNGSYIYALLGGRYEDINRTLFYQYNISNNSWKQLSNTSHAQGAGNALTGSGYDNLIYAIIGNKDHNTIFACYNASNNSWSNELNWISTRLCG